MPGPLADAAFPGIRAEFDRMLTHRYTRQAMASGPVDSEGNAPPVPDGAPDEGVPCLYATVDRVVRDEGGVTLVSVPTLMVSATDPLKVGWEVTPVTDQLGGILLAGPAHAERVLDDTAGLGASFVRIWELRGAKVSG